MDFHLLAARAGTADTVPVSDPEVRYAKSGDVAIAYMVVGDGPRDLVFVHGADGKIEIEREAEWVRRFQDRLAGFSRLITFDRRGTGLSDRPREPATLEAHVVDVGARAAEGLVTA